MGSPFKMTPGGPGKGTARTTGSGLASRGLVNPSSAPTHMHEGKKHSKTESLSKKAPSATIESRFVENKPGSVRTSKTKSSGGKKTTAAYDAVVKSEGTKIVDPKKITPEMTAAANLKRKKAKATDKANSSSSSSSSKTVVTKPSRKVTESSRTISRGESAYDIQRKAELANKNSASRRAMQKEMAENRATSDSIKAADSNRMDKSRLKKSYYDDERVKTNSVKIGNSKARNTLKKAGYHTDAEMETMFSSNYGDREGVAGPQGYKNKDRYSRNRKSITKINKAPGEKLKRSGTYKRDDVMYPGSKEDVGYTNKGNQKGSIKYGKANPNAGTRGSRGQ